MADALWEPHTLHGLTAHRLTHRQTKVKTVYPPVSRRSLGGYNYSHNHYAYAKVCSHQIWDALRCGCAA